MKIAYIVPANYNVNKYIVDVEAKKGDNILGLQGEGEDSDKVGATVDNVSLKRCACGGNEDAIINGGFEEGHNVGQGSGSFPKITGWDGGKYGIEIGIAFRYNAKWPQSTHVTELDSIGNTMITQTITLDSLFRVVTPK